MKTEIMRALVLVFAQEGVNRPLPPRYNNNLHARNRLSQKGRRKRAKWRS